MKDNKNGFTLIELLAVIVILGVILVVAGTSVLGSKRKANVEEAKSIEKTLSDLGAGIYSYEIISGDKSTSGGFYQLYKSGNKFVITLDELGRADYLKDLTNDKKIKNPFGGEGCDGYLLIDPVPEEPSFKGYINCGTNNYVTEGWSNENYPKATLTESQ